MLLFKMGSFHLQHLLEIFNGRFFSINNFGLLILLSDSISALSNTQNTASIKSVCHITYGPSRHCISSKKDNVLAISFIDIQFLTNSLRYNPLNDNLNS